MELTPLEVDLLGDLAQDDHAVYELFHFVRGHHPGADDAEVFRRGRELLMAWLERGWLAISPDAGVPPARGLAGLLDVVDAYGVTATYGFDGAPWLTLAPRGGDAYKRRCAAG